MIFIKIIVMILSLLVPVLFGIIVYRLFMSQRPRKLVGNLKYIVKKSMHESKIDFFSFDRINIYLSRSGVNYMFDSKVTPMVYMCIRFGLMIIGFAGLCYKEGIAFGIVGGVLGFYFFDILIRISNNKDNDTMLYDIKSMYDSLKIQTKAGVYLTSSLSECYLCVECGRLKSALLELNSQIIAKKDIETAVDEFNIKFNNTYIDAFCIVVKQSLESGQAINALSSISNQISDVQSSINTRQANTLARRTQLLELLIFVGIIAIALYYLVSQLSADFLMN